MGVYIKNMKMPEGQHTVTITICHDGYAVVEFRDRDDYPAKIEAYQAVPVPPHGDLIDRDMVLKKSWDMETFYDAVRFAPTVIPAEREGE